MTPAPPKAPTPPPFASMNLFPQTPPGDPAEPTAPGVFRQGTPKLVPFLCENPPASGVGCTTLLVLPGGGFDFLADDMAEPIAQNLQAQGFSALVLRYRTPTKVPLSGPNRTWGPLIDVQRAVRLVRHMALGSALGKINKDAIGVMGMSAGGAVTATLSASWNETLYAPIDAADTQSAKPDFNIIMYPSSTNTTEHGTQGTMPAVDALGKLTLPVGKMIAPSFIGVAKDDDVTGTEGPRQLYKEFRREEGNVATSKHYFHLFTTGGHDCTACDRYGKAQGTTCAEKHGCVSDCCGWITLATNWLRGVAPSMVSLGAIA